MHYLAWIARTARNFTQQTSGSVAPFLGLSMVPILATAGMAIDYARASSFRSSIQSAIDAATLAAAGDGSAAWQQTALNIFNANVAAIPQLSMNQNTIGTPTFSLDAAGNYSGAVSASLPLAFGFFGTSSVNVSASSIAVGGGNGADSCILTLDGGDPLSNVSLLFAGAPNVQLAGCAVRSNTSMNCNGHAGGATVSIAAGTATGCSNAQSYARAVPDQFARLAGNIAPQCGNARPGASWTAGTIPGAPAVIQVANGGYTEYHVCGNLTVSGTGNLIGPASVSDSLVVIENGTLNLSNNASVTTSRTAIVFTGSNVFGSAINFPNGNGQSASLILSPPTDSGPWQGISLYQDPRLTTSVDDNWGPSATFNADGVVYMPNANLTMRGIAGSSNYRCSKIVTKSFTTNGSVILNFAQTDSGCSTIGMQRWSDVPLHLSN